VYPIVNLSASLFSSINHPVNISRYGIQESISTVINRPSGNSDFLIILFYDPARIGTYHTDRCYPSHTLMVWPPGSAHYYGNDGCSWNHSWLHVSGPSIEKILTRHRIPLTTPVTLSDYLLVEHYLQLIHKEISCNAHPHPEILEMLFRCMVLELSRSLHQTALPSIPAPLLEAKNHIETHFVEPLTLSGLASAACLSISRFSASFKHYIGYSPIDYLINIRMRHAAFLLKDINRSVMQVAQESGYEDIYYFSKLFKKHFGVSPRGYRSALRNESVR
jgi:AraC-like DNA-binding protein